MYAGDYELPAVARSCGMLRPADEVSRVSGWSNKGPTIRVALLGIAIGSVGFLVSEVHGVAPAAAATSNGRICTIVGTLGNDVLKGTARDDVICGLGW